MRGVETADTNQTVEEHGKQGESNCYLWCPTMVTIGPGRLKMYLFKDKRNINPPKSKHSFQFRQTIAPTKITVTSQAQRNRIKPKGMTYVWTPVYESSRTCCRLVAAATQEVPTATTSTSSLSGKYRYHCYWGECRRISSPK